MSPVLRPLLLLICLQALLVSCVNPGPARELAKQPPITIAATTPFASQGNIRQKVVDECQVERKLPHYLIEYARGNRINVVTTEEPLDKVPGKTLELVYTEVIGYAGGSWSGAKILTVEGVLFDNGEAIASFTAMRSSLGGFMGEFKGTCAIFGRCAKALGRDIANWLKQPRDGARLGEL